MYEEQKIKRSYFAICHKVNAPLLNFGKYLSNDWDIFYLSNDWDIFRINEKLFEKKDLRVQTIGNSYQIPAALEKHNDIIYIKNKLFNILGYINVKIYVSVSPIYTFIEVSFS